MLASPLSFTGVKDIHI